jgi:hypothetical protein
MKRASRFTATRFAGLSVTLAAMWCGGIVGLAAAQAAPTVPKDSTMA